MQPVRETMDVRIEVGDLLHRVSDPVSKFHQRSVAFLQVSKTHEYHAELLSDIVVKLPRKPSAFVFVCVDQLAAHRRKRFSGHFAIAAPAQATKDPSESN